MKIIIIKKLSGQVFSALKAGDLAQQLTVKSEERLMGKEMGETG
jgi:hypothetical protein